MKLAVTVLASILLACSVTTAKPVNPSATTSATTSAEASTSTVTPTATTSTKSEYRVLSYEGSEFSLDLSKFSEDDMGLIQEYLQADQEYEEIKKARDSAKSEEFNQKELLKRVLGESYELSLKYPNRGDPVYQEKREIINQKVDEEDEKFFSLQEKLLELDEDLYCAGVLLHLARENLADLLFKNNPSTASLDSYRRYLKSNRNFVKNIYQSLILRLSQQSGSEQPSTSGTQNKSKHHKSPSSSSKTSTVQPTQTSSSTQATSSSTQKTSRSSRSHSRSRSRKTSRSHSRSRKAYSKMKNNLGSGWNQLENEDSDSD
ncbi:hypothetical protein BATDEDRAFT_28544 [Batrachochytrium dendrobatidis JAM81]|uniref:Uncharacterized protein n=2 Tax=Batrachochytrium dendrobatidis TaxID=109871 RepID=F4PED4_BATDJ|nr:uncharacterized protein BATDEDRAFT_28544 [Batrachochytrium dendrobatidis JAM81]EGF76355.1 hypothetical protein BATDEDRAFT_28544 [Batrachochytrium dendrobatidis JAM81]OAJ45427.1 hypothetical protein BDEG_28567 [Batrachochytrium dendrobatidis JEL423]|eukprot:XP_006682961.1 hypothetical protein BATDEDRAFT_28544 [Batrachochytrium dendrobatidis JAM81]